MRPHHVTGAFLTCRCSIRVSMTLGGAARGGPSGDETGNIVYAIPDVPASAAENHQSVLVSRDANGAR
jgi:hypothetical protein